MLSTILTLAAVVATAVADLGSGTIINMCDYEVDLNNVPSADGVHTAYQTTLAPNGGSYSQTWTSLANGNGWSMKLNPSSETSTIMQFEYTYSVLAPEDLWFDLSYVNGMPFEKDWVISSNSASCAVKQTAYNDPTDDANGMQPLCSPDTDVTVTLCSTVAGTVDSAVSSVIAPVVSSTSVADKVAAVVEPTTSSTEEVAPATTTEAAPTTSSIEATSTTVVGSQAFSYLDTVASVTSDTPSPTTLATVTTSASLSTKADGYVVTMVDTVIATDVVTVYGHGHHDKRREHVHRHAHRAARF